MAGVDFGGRSKADEEVVTMIVLRKLFLLTRLLRFLLDRAKHDEVIVEDLYAVQSISTCSRVFIAQELDYEGERIENFVI